MSDYLRTTNGDVNIGGGTNDDIGNGNAGGTTSNGNGSTDTIGNGRANVFGDPSPAFATPNGNGSTNSATSGDDAPMSIPKPNISNGGLAKFRSTLTPTIAGVQTLLTALPHHGMSDARDWVRLHPDDENYWSPPLCFVTVPIQGQKRDLQHLIVEDLAVQYLESARIQRFRLALATKPFDVYFLCSVPSQNLDNPWNDTNLRGCVQAKTAWAQAVSRKAEGVDGYKITYAQNQDAFPAPTWPKQTLDEIILTSFAGRLIDNADHPALLRLIGAKQSLS